MRTEAMLFWCVLNMTFAQTHLWITEMDRHNHVYGGCKKNQEGSNYIYDHLRVCRDFFWLPWPQNTASLIMSFEGHCSSYTFIGRVASSAVFRTTKAATSKARSAAFKAFTQYDFYAMQKDELQWVVTGCTTFLYRLGPNLDFFLIGKSIQKDVDQTEVDVFLTSAFQSVPMSQHLGEAGEVEKKVLPCNTEFCIALGVATQLGETRWRQGEVGTTEFSVNQDVNFACSIGTWNP